MSEEAVEHFRENYRETLQSIESERSETSDNGHPTLVSSIVDQKTDKVAVVQELYRLTRELVNALNDQNGEEVEKVSMEIIHGSLDYLAKWGTHTPVTAGEQHEESDTKRPPVKRLAELFEDKGEDYESNDISYLSYCILGHWSIAHEVHKKGQRLYSVTKDTDPKFETAEDTVFDLCNYTLFLKAYLSLPDDLNRNWILVDCIDV